MATFYLILSYSFILIGGILIAGPSVFYRQLQLKVLDPQILDPIIYIPHLSYKTALLAIYIYNRFHYSQCPYYLSVIVLSYSFYNLCFIRLPYKSWSFRWCFFTHLLNLFEFSVVSSSICLQISIILSGFFFFSDFSFHPNSYRS